MRSVSCNLIESVLSASFTLKDFLLRNAASIGFLVQCSFLVQLKETFFTELMFLTDPEDGHMSDPGTDEHVMLFMAAYGRL